MSDIPLNFVGPFTFVAGEKSLFHSPVSQSPGIYLWTIRQRADESHLIHYVGETVSFANRQREHLIQILGLNYGIFDPEKGQQGICEIAWAGLWRNRSPDGPSGAVDAYQALHGTVVNYVNALNVFFAELQVEDRLRKHIEGCIGWNLRVNHPEAKLLYPDDNHIGAMSGRERGNLLISSTGHIRGLDERIAY